MTLSALNPTEGSGLSSNLPSHHRTRKSGCCRCIQKIWKVVKEILLGACHAILFATTPTIYAISFVVAIIFNKQMELAVERIRKIWKTKTWGMLLIGGVGAFLSLPITVATASWAFATQLSCRLVRRAEAAPAT